jgi:hypothetical protein
MQRPRQGALVCCAVEWAPSAPNRLTDGEMDEYRQGRNAALAQIAAELGITAAVIEL